MAGIGYPILVNGDLLRVFASKKSAGEPLFLKE
jgi:hypothetical protein